MNVLGILFNMYAVMYVYLLKKKERSFLEAPSGNGQKYKSGHNKIRVATFYSYILPIVNLLCQITMAVS